MINSIANSSVNQTSTSRYVNNARLPQVPDSLLSKSNLSESELERRIMELARRDAAAGKNLKFGGKMGNGSPEWQQLQLDYISVASPDRKGIIANTLSNFANKLNTQQVNRGPANLFEALFQNRWISNDIHGNFIDFRDANGNIVAKWDEHRGFMAMATPAEGARTQEFRALWDKAIAAANAEVENNASTREIAGKMIIRL